MLILDIPKNLIEMIEMSWEGDSNFHLLGYFDLAGGLDGKPIKLIEEIAYKAGFITVFEFVEKVHFGAEEGSLSDESDAFDYWFKLIPYEYISKHKPELADILTGILKNKRCICSICLIRCSFNQ